MTKLEALLSGKLEERKIKNKAKRVELALNASELNFKSQKDDNEVKLEELMEKFNDPNYSVEKVIEEISDTLDEIEEANEGLSKVKRIKDILFGEVEE